jgi:predicted nucleic acid-binding protein
VSELVLDCSVAASWCFIDEASPETDGIYERVRDGGAIVPCLWRIELGNVLLQAERRGRITAGTVAARLELMAELPIVTDREMSALAWRATIALARAERLTAYDASYLELAIRLGLPLATKDAALATATRNLGLRVLPE